MTADPAAARAPSTRQRTTRTGWLVGAALLTSGCASWPVLGPASGPPAAPASSAIPATRAARATGAATIEQADAAYAAGERERARELYRAVLAAQPKQSRALFRLAQLSPPGSHEAVQLLGRYVELEPRDPWGYMALGDALAAAGKPYAGLAQYAQARRLTPDEPDVLDGSARILEAVGDVDGLIALYEAQTARQPDNIAAWIALGRARQRASHHAEAAQAYARAQTRKPEPRTLERLDAALAEAATMLRPFGGSGRDSDDNRVTRAGLDLLVPAGSRARLGLRAERADIADPTTEGHADLLAIIGNWAPSHALRIEAAGGLTRLTPASGNADDRPVGRLRLRWRESQTSPAADVLVSRRPLLATPALLAAPVDLTEARASLDLPVSSAFALRLGGQTGRFAEPAGSNSRSGGRIGLVHRASPVWETQASASVLGYDRPSSAGYFAPRRIEALELGTYVEYYALWPLTLTIDAGVGSQRITPHGEPARGWQGTLRAYTSFAWDLQPGMQLALELDFENSLAATAATATSEDWRSLTALLSLRFGVLRRSTHRALTEARRDR